ncbi:hypothetical protein Phi39:1_gp39 [Cellulophaga phage phi39:1]|uniref:hypothetical protein n=1 Tax=Cellulophaga phage phi39:1 TaxID=1327993 RepID=UPI000351A920|nr:hypothetical protein Phi39:1_gp39 [Cellulophaga phage phi39:1]AGO49154.1 hypothetical protein Phi39:1_gp39 [Cellulophaga phage phi39:1]
MIYHNKFTIAVSLSNPNSYFLFSDYISTEKCFSFSNGFIFTKKEVSFSNEEKDFIINYFKSLEQ